MGGHVVVLSWLEVQLKILSSEIVNSELNDAVEVLPIGDLAGETEGIDERTLP